MIVGVLLAPVLMSVPERCGRALPCPTADVVSDAYSEYRSGRPAMVPAGVKAATPFQFDGVRQLKCSPAADRVTVRCVFSASWSDASPKKVNCPSMTAAGLNKSTMCFNDDKPQRLFETVVADLRLRDGHWHVIEATWATTL